jgi:hypothetical protein
VILPWFGGSSAVWSTCMVFFQMTLLLGYLYAHWLDEVRAGKQQAIVHTVMIAASLIALPILPNASWKPTGPENPSLRILGLLAVTIGLPCFMLSSTSPLLQAWYARRNRGIPYRLFALSNLASMMALLTYPVLVEPNFTTRFQGEAWSAGYIAFAIACTFAAWHASASKADAPRSRIGQAAAVPRGCCGCARSSNPIALALNRLAGITEPSSILRWPAVSSCLVYSCGLTIFPNA